MLPPVMDAVTGQVGGERGSRAQDRAYAGAHADRGVSMMATRLAVLLLMTHLATGIDSCMTPPTRCWFAASGSYFRV